MINKKYTKRKIIQLGGAKGTGMPKIKASKFSVKTEGNSFPKLAIMTNAEYKKHSLRKEIKKHSGANWGRFDEYMKATQAKADARMLPILQKQHTWIRRAISPEAQKQQLAKAQAIQAHYNTKKIEELKRVIDVAEKRATQQGITLASRPNIVDETDVANRLAQLKTHADNIRRQIASHHLAENTKKLQKVADAKARFVNAVAIRNNYLRAIAKINQLGKKLKATKNAQEAMQIKQMLIKLDENKKKLKGQVNAISSSEMRRMRNNWQQLEKEYGKTTLSGKQAKLERLEKGLAKPVQENYEELISRGAYKTIKRGLKTGSSNIIKRRNLQLAKLVEPTATKLKPLQGAEYTQDVVKDMSDRVLQEAIEHFELQPNMKALSERLRLEKIRRMQMEALQQKHTLIPKIILEKKIQPSLQGSPPSPIPTNQNDINGNSNA
jgi:hypothetical protein